MCLTEHKAAHLHQATHLPTENFTCFARQVPQVISKVETQDISNNSDNIHDCG